MERDADVDRFTVDEVIARYASDPQQAIAGLLQALGKYYPLKESDPRSHSGASDVEESYRRIALRSHDIIDLANLPEDDRNLAAKQFELRRLYVALRAQRQTSGDSTQEWVKKAEVNSGRRAGVPTELADRLKALERENRELRQANEILRKASAYFAQAELVPRPGFETALCAGHAASLNLVAALVSRAFCSARI